MRERGILQEIIKQRYETFTKTECGESKVSCNLNNLQGDPNQNLKFVLAITQKICISDPILVKPKCVWKVSV